MTTLNLRAAFRPSLSGAEPVAVRSLIGALTQSEAIAMRDLARAAVLDRLG